MNRSQAVAGRVLGITPDSLSDADYEQLARLIFDYAGCAYSGTAQPAGRGMRAWAKTYAGAGQAGLLAETQKFTRDHPGGERPSALQLNCFDEFPVPQRDEKSIGPIMGAEVDALAQKYGDGARMNVVQRIGRRPSCGSMAVSRQVR